LLRLPSLAPDIITAILNGKSPPQLTAKKLAPRIPVDEQFPPAVTQNQEREQALSFATAASKTAINSPGNPYN